MVELDVIGCLKEIEPMLEGVHRQAVSEAIARLLSMGEQLDVFKKSLAARYRRSSEKVDPGQLTLDVLGFVAGQTEANKKAAEDCDSDTQEPLQRPARPKRDKRRSATKTLPVERVVKKLDEEERTCACGRTMAVVGHDVRRQIVYTPAPRAIG